MRCDSGLGAMVMSKYGVIIFLSVLRREGLIMVCSIKNAETGI